jgi:nitrous oxidase accessory protein
MGRCSKPKIDARQNRHARLGCTWSSIAGLVACGLLAVSPTRTAGEAVRSTSALVAAVRARPEGATITIAPGTYELEAPLEPKPGTTLVGAGIGKTVITHVSSWEPSTGSLPDPEMTTKGLDSQAYLVRLPDRAAAVTIANLTLRAPQLHGAVFGFRPVDLHLHHVRIERTRWSGLRTFGMRGARIHDCEFVDAGGRWKRGGRPGTDGGITGGAIFAVWMSDSEIAHNRFVRTNQEKAGEFYGIKCRQAKRCRIHHNTIGVNFSLELPFENDEDVEIDHNVCHGTISIPKYAGGRVPESGRTFHIHHNWLRNSYAIEFVRNGVEIDHNLFDFDVERDHGNLISAFGKAAADGPAVFHNNLVSNPGRGVVWMNEVFNNLTVRNNHIIARRTVTPRTEGLFGLNRDCDFHSIRICDNVIECREQPRPLMRNEASYGAVIRNNVLENVSDADRLENRRTGATVGPEEPLQFRCGVHGQFTVDQWTARPTAD